MALISVRRKLQCNRPNAVIHTHLTQCISSWSLEALTKHSDGHGDKESLFQTKDIQMVVKNSISLLKTETYNSHM